MRGPAQIAGADGIEGDEGAEIARRSVAIDIGLHAIRIRLVRASEQQHYLGVLQRLCGQCGGQRQQHRHPAGIIVGPLHGQRGQILHGAGGQHERTAGQRQPVDGAHAAPANQRIPQQRSAGEEQQAEAGGVDEMGQAAARQRLRQARAVAVEMRDQREEVPGLTAGGDARDDVAAVYRPAQRRHGHAALVHAVERPCAAQREHAAQQPGKTPALSGQQPGHGGRQRRKGLPAGGGWRREAVLADVYPRQLGQRRAHERCGAGFRLAACGARAQSAQRAQVHHQRIFETGFGHRLAPVPCGMIIESSLQESVGLG